MGTYKHLSINERELIYLYNGMNFSVRRIAKFLKRHPSTISRELRRHTKDGTIHRLFRNGNMN